MGLQQILFSIGFNLNILFTYLLLIYPIFQVLASYIFTILPRYRQHSISFIHNSTSLQVTNYNFIPTKQNNYSIFNNRNYQIIYIRKCNNFLYLKFNLIISFNQIFCRNL